ncbi:16S rRNA (cytosine(1402)-N(4))-methyltransferase [Burkholderia thailandensis]|nr:16S rRNA (cytosine(1402)-N(4))-methyltransferase [Burkholderia thailandensis]
MGNELQHRTVLLDEAVDALVTRPDGVYVDGTFGRGGHSRAVLARLSDAGRLIAFDKDPRAIETASGIEDARFEIVHDSFAAMKGALDARGVGRVSGVLLDLGVSSPQVDDPERGFSFRANGPLDMRMDPTRGESAAEWLARASVQELTEVIRDYGEERFAFQIAKAIVARRAESDRLGPLDSTGELAQIVGHVVKTREKGKDPATRTFQAIRIHVNQELADLQVVLEAALSLLEQGGGWWSSAFIRSRTGSSSDSCRRTQARLRSTADCRSARSTCPARRSSCLDACFRATQKSRPIRVPVRR